MPWLESSCDHRAIRGLPGRAAVCCPRSRGLRTARIAPLASATRARRPRSIGGAYGARRQRAAAARATRAMRSQRGVRRGALRQGQRAVERDREEIGRRLGGDWEGIGRGCQNHKGGASSTFCLKKWRLLHLLSQKVASPPPFVSKSGMCELLLEIGGRLGGDWLGGCHLWRGRACNSSTCVSSAVAEARRASRVHAARSSSRCGCLSEGTTSASVAPTSLGLR